MSRPGAVAKALAVVIRVQYRSRLSAADLASVTRQIQTGPSGVTVAQAVPYRSSHRHAGDPAGSDPEL